MRTFRRHPAHAPRAVSRPAADARMRGAIALPAADPEAAAPQRVAYIPPQLLARYERAKILGGLLFAAIFAGWLWLQWSNPWMRAVALALVALTAWWTITSVLHDARRHTGRLLELAGSSLLITTPEGTCWVKLDHVDHAVWSEDRGLTFMRVDGQALGGIDTHQLATEEEARRFMGWLRRHTAVGWNVRWPSPA